jgi:putative SOS response-associated peptidase YedK
MCNKAEQRDIDPVKFKSITEKNFRPVINNINGNTTLNPVIFPGKDIMILRYENNSYLIETMKWGLLLTTIKRPLNNKRIEDIHEKKYWYNLFANQRILIPLTAFYEWRKADKQQFRIFSDVTDIFFAGGFFTPPKHNEGLNRCTMLTRSANKFMQNIHDRMPVIFNASDAKEFLHSDPDSAIDMAVTLSDNIQIRSEKVTA